MRKVLSITMLAGLSMAMVSPTFADNRVSASKKGSLLIYSKVELKWGIQGNLLQDTFLDISNDFPAGVNVQMYFVNGDEPLEAVFAGDPPELVEREHPGWNWVDCQIHLTADQPAYWSAYSGYPVGCQPFTILDPGFPPGRPDLENPGQRVLRGFVYAWAVDSAGEEINWNHLSGDATIVNYALGTAWEYNAYAAQACPGNTCAHGAAPDGTPGQLLLDGVEYDIAYDKLLFDFYAATNVAFTGDGCTVVMDTDLTLFPVSQDLRQDNDGPITTKAKFDIWNMNEIRLSGTERCITCWDQTLLSNYDDPNNMLIHNLQTEKGKARIDGIGSTQCPFSVDAAILGVAAKQMTFNCVNGIRFAAAGRTLVGQGEESAVIRNDIIMPPSTLTAPGMDAAGFEAAGAKSGKRSSR